MFVLNLYDKVFRIILDWSFERFVDYIWFLKVQKPKHYTLSYNEASQKQCLTIKVERLAANDGFALTTLFVSCFAID